MKSKNSSLCLLNELIVQELMKNKNRYPANEKRVTKLLKKPERTDSDNDEWFIYVPSCFNDCLDIKKTQRMTLNESTGEKIVKKIWTQGSRFSFEGGCVLYDTPKAYQCWENALKSISYCITIQSGYSAQPAMNKQEREAGIVDFKILRPSLSRLKLEEFGNFTLTQDDFIRFLIAGNPDIIKDNSKTLFE